jgi:hypothetical protein
MSKKTYGWDGEFKEGQKIWFMGVKGVVERDVDRGLPHEWMVPVALKGTIYVTIAHCGALTPRGKKQ